MRRKGSKGKDPFERHDLKVRWCWNNLPISVGALSLLLAAAFPKTRQFVYYYVLNT